MGVSLYYTECPPVAARGRKYWWGTFLFCCVNSIETNTRRCMNVQKMATFQFFVKIISLFMFRRGFYKAKKKKEKLT
jgi:hypothetical protein